MTKNAVYLFKEDLNLMETTHAEYAFEYIQIIYSYYNNEGKKDLYVIISMSNKIYEFWRSFFEWYQNKKLIQSWDRKSFIIKIHVVELFIPTPLKEVDICTDIVTCNVHCTNIVSKFFIFYRSSLTIYEYLNITESLTATYILGCSRQ